MIMVTAAEHDSRFPTRSRARETQRDFFLLYYPMSETKKETEREGKKRVKSLHGRIIRADFNFFPFKNAAPITCVLLPFMSSQLFDQSILLRNLIFSHS